MYNAIETPLGRQRANRSPASPCDALRLLPTQARRGAGDHCDLSMVDPAGGAHQPPSRARSECACDGTARRQSHAQPLASQTLSWPIRRSLRRRRASDHAFASRPTGARPTAGSPSPWPSPTVTAGGRARLIWHQLAYRQAGVGCVSGYRFGAPGERMSPLDPGGAGWWTRSL